MRLKVVNEQEKNLVYVVTDSTECLNLPRLGENEILLAGCSPSQLIQHRQGEAQGRAEGEPGSATASSSGRSSWTAP